MSGTFPPRSAYFYDIPSVSVLFLHPLGTSMTSQPYYMSSSPGISLMLVCLASPIAALSGVQFNKSIVQGVLAWSEHR
jgi:hypothetical protein